MKKLYDFIIVGGGVTGLNIGRRLAGNHSVLLIDKDHCGAHASSKNSGVIHAGIYYAASSLKAKFCKSGNAQLTTFCQEHNVDFANIGKILCMTDPSKLPLLEELYSNAKECDANVSLIDYQEAKEIEPRIKQYDKYIWSPDTAIGNPVQYITALKKVFNDLGGEILEGTKYLNNVHKNESEIKIHTSQGDFTCNYLISAAGLYADNIAHEYGFGLDYEILPFRGIYVYAPPDFKGYNTLVYPVPDFTKHVFLGVHTTETTQGRTKMGPTAIPCLWRQQYGGMQHFDLSEMLAILKRTAICGTSDYFSLYFNTLMSEFKKYRMKTMLKDVDAMVDDANYSNFHIRGKSCVFPQLVNTETSALAMDFMVEGDHRSTHVLNVISPGWTCSIPFSDYIVDQIEENLGQKI